MSNSSTEPCGGAQADLPRQTTARAFLALVPDLRRAARRLTRSAEDADTLVQDTLLRVWSRLARARLDDEDAAPVTDLRALAFVTLRNCARTRPSGPPLTSADTVGARAGQGTGPEARPQSVNTLQALSGLPADQQTLLRLRLLDGLSHAEIAAATGLPMGTVTSRLSRGRRALRAALQLPGDAPLTGLFPDPPRS